MKGVISKAMYRFLAEMEAYTHYCGYNSALVWMDAHRALERALGVRPTTSQIKKYLFDHANLQLARGRITEYFRIQNRLGDGRIDKNTERIISDILLEIETDVSGRLLAQEIGDLKQLCRGTLRSES